MYTVIQIKAQLILSKESVEKKTKSVWGTNCKINIYLTFMLKDYFQKYCNKSLNVSF